MNLFHFPAEENGPSLGCYECFSLNHNTVDCNQKRKPDFFVPRIDQNLHSRFFQTLDVVEKYSMAFSSPSYMHFFKPNGIAVARDIFLPVHDVIDDDSDDDMDDDIIILDSYINGNTDRISKYVNRDVLVLQKLELYNELPGFLDNLLASNALAIRCKRIHLENIINFPIKYLLQLISPTTKTLSCKNVTFDSVMEFVEIFPVVEDIELINTNVQIQCCNGPREFTKFSYGNNKWLLGDFFYHDVEIPNFIKLKKKRDIHLKMTDLTVSQPSPFFKALPNFVLMITEDITLRNIPMFTTETLLLFLTSQTTRLILQNVQFDSVIKFSEILSKIPNIQEFKVKETNIDIGNSWPDDLMKSIAGRSLMKLSMYLDIYDFDFGKLAEFMKSRMGTNFYIHLEIAHAEFAPSTLQEKIESHFVPYEISKSNQPVLNIIHIIRDHHNSLISTNLILSLP